MTKGDLFWLKAAELASGVDSPRKILSRIAEFVQNNILYSLDEWDRQPEEVMRKKQGMCAGKALLAAELYRASGIPVRFKAIKITGEEGLFDFVKRRLEERLDFEELPKVKEVLLSLKSLPLQRDHVIIQAFLDDRWVDLDLARDRELDYGMRLIGIWRERKVLSVEGVYDSLDSWLKERMRRRVVIQERQSFFQVVNNEIEKVRQAGRLARKAGIQAWTEAEVRESLEDWGIISQFPAFRDEEKLVDWLYSLVRRNIKRGRLWEIADVITRHQADCLGYARLLSFLATYFGLKAGVVEVVQDNCGRYVPHYVCLVNLSNGQKRFVDPWYGSTNVRHRLLTARVKEGERLIIKQLPQEAVESRAEVEGLSPEQVAGVSFYILGNSYLARGMMVEALDCYNTSLWLYPQNPRTLFNRAIALEKIDKAEQAKMDYQRAFSIDLSIGRILATIDEIEPLIELDERGIDERDQQIYLLRKGFITGREEEWAGIAYRLGTTQAEIEARFNSVLAKLSR